MEVHSEHKDGWRPDRATIVIQTNPFLEQREHNNITSLSDKIIATT